MSHRFTWMIDLSRSTCYLFVIQATTCDRVISLLLCWFQPATISFTFVNNFDINDNYFTQHQEQGYVAPFNNYYVQKVEERGKTIWGKSSLKKGHERQTKNAAYAAPN